MKIYESVVELFKHTPAKKLANIINLSKSQIYRYAEDPASSGSRLPADLIPVITRISGCNVIIQNLCSLCGGVFIPIKNKEERSKDVDYMKVVQKRINATKTVIDANIDKKITKEELKKIKKEIYESIMASAEYIQSIEEEKEQEEDYEVL